MNSLVVEANKEISIKGWEVKYYFDGMQPGDLLWRSQHLQPDGKLRCSRYVFVNRQQLIAAVKHFYLHVYDPMDPLSPLCPAQVSHGPDAEIGYVRSVGICHAVEPYSGEDVYAIIRHVNAKPELQWLNPIEPSPTWGPGKYTGSKQEILGAFDMLARSSPNFADGKVYYLNSWL